MTVDELVEDRAKRWSEIDGHSDWCRLGWIAQEIYRHNVKRLLSHPDLFIKDNVNSRVDVELYITLAEVL